MKNIHAIILARGNSKGIKNKNLKIVNGKPMLYWSMISALKSKRIDYVWVSSDSDKILNYAKKIGARTIKRPSKYSKDYTSSDLSWLHAVKKIELKFKIDFILGIQPTSPLRGKSDFDKAIVSFFKRKLDSLFSCCELKDHLVWKKDKNKLIPNYKKRKVMFDTNI